MCWNGKQTKYCLWSVWQLSSMALLQGLILICGYFELNSAYFIIGEISVSTNSGISTAPESRGTRLWYRCIWLSFILSNRILRQQIRSSMELREYDKLCHLHMPLEYCWRVMLPFYNVPWKESLFALSEQILINCDKICKEVLFPCVC